MVWYGMVWYGIAAHLASPWWVEHVEDHGLDLERELRKGAHPVEAGAGLSSSRSTLGPLIPSRRQGRGISGMSLDGDTH